VRKPRCASRFLSQKFIISRQIVCSHLSCAKHCLHRVQPSSQKRMCLGPSLRRHRRVTCVSARPTTSRWKKMPQNALTPIVKMVLPCSGSSLECSKTMLECARLVCKNGFGSIFGTTKARSGCQPTWGVGTSQETAALHLLQAANTGLCQEYMHFRIALPQSRRRSPSSFSVIDFVAAATCISAGKKLLIWSGAGGTQEKLARKLTVECGAIPC